MALSEKAKAELATRMKDQKEEALLFQGVLGSKDGLKLLEVLSKMCNENEPTFVDQNPTGSAYKEGQRSIIIGIRKKINRTFEEKQGKASI
jgi:hypothetical protein